MVVIFFTNLTYISYLHISNFLTAIQVKSLNVMTLAGKSSERNTKCYQTTSQQYNQVMK